MSTSWGRTREPSALVIEGDAGIGKTTLWLDTLAEHASVVLWSWPAGPPRPVRAGVCGAGDLLSDVDESIWADHPLGNSKAGRGLCRVAAASCRAMPEWLRRSSSARSTGGPGPGCWLVAIDDVQWIDISSANVGAPPPDDSPGRG